MPPIDVGSVYLPGPGACLRRASLLSKKRRLVPIPAVDGRIASRFRATVRSPIDARWYASGPGESIPVLTSSVARTDVENLPAAFERLVLSTCLPMVGGKEYLGPGFSCAELLFRSSMGARLRTRTRTAAGAEPQSTDPVCVGCGSSVQPIRCDGAPGIGQQRKFASTTVRTGADEAEICGAGGGQHKAQQPPCEPRRHVLWWKRKAERAPASGGLNLGDAGADVLGVAGPDTIPDDTPRRARVGSLAPPSTAARPAPGHSERITNTGKSTLQKVLVWGKARALGEQAALSGSPSQE